MPAGSERARWIALLRRCHIWTGLFAFTGLLVFAAAGLHVSFRPAGARRATAPPAVSEIAFRADPALSDEQLADRVHAELRLPLSQPLPASAVRRDRDHRLRLDFRTPNGVHRVTVLEEEGKLRIEHRANGLGEFLDLMHMRTFGRTPPAPAFRLWAAYVDLSIFALLFLALSGVWLWLESRPGARWAQGTLALGGALFAAVWWALR